MNIKKNLGAFSFLVIGIVIGLLISTPLELTPKAHGQEASSQTTATSPTTDLTQAVERVARDVGPTVVSIKTEKTEKYSVRRQFHGSPFGDDIFERFFEDFFGDLPEQEHKRSGLGSGVIISKEGYILTNEHVIEDTDKITVTLADGREFKGILKGTDPRSDLAVVKIDAPHLPWAALGDSDSLRTGQWVVAIGSPFGNIMPNPEPTVTAGVISALHRSLPQTSRRDSNYADLIQTDAAINPGNSGGPLLNLSGEVIGINVALFSTSGGYQGIGFAIPVNTAKRIVSKLIEGKEIEYGWIGVSVQNINQQLAEYFGIKTTEGALVVKILEDGPAAKAGLKDGDLIVSVDGKSIKDVAALLSTVGNIPIKKSVPVTVMRDKKTINLSVTVAKRPFFDEQGEMAESDKKDRSDANTSNRWRGLTVQNIPPELANRLRLNKTDGILITDVKENSPAESAGLRKGDIITGINNQAVKNIADFNAATKKARGDCLIRTIRGYLVIKDGS